MLLRRKYALLFPFSELDKPPKTQEAYLPVPSHRLPNLETWQIWIWSGTSKNEKCN